VFTSSGRFSHRPAIAVRNTSVSAVLIIEFTVYACGLTYALSWCSRSRASATGFTSSSSAAVQRDSVASG
jgi:hypothetical protein